MSDKGSDSNRVKIVQKDSSPKTALRSYKRDDNNLSPTKSLSQYKDVLPKFLEVKKVSKQEEKQIADSPEILEATLKKQNVSFENLHEGVYEFRGRGASNAIQPSFSQII